MTDENKKSTGLSEALLLALVPAIAYGMAYLYEAAYCNAFEIPRHLISLSPTTVLAVTFGLLSSLVFVLWIANLVGGILYPDILGSPIGRAVHGMLIPVVATIIILILNRPSGLFWYFSGVLLILGLLTFVFPLITNRKRKSYADKLEGQEEIEANVFLLSDHLRNLPLRLRAIVILSAVCLWAAHLLVDGDARRQTKFLIPKSQPDRVVLRHYGDLLILAKFDRKSKVVSPEFSFVALASDDIAAATSFLREEVGPLENRTDNP